MARPPDATSVACPICGSLPGEGCTRYRLTADRELVKESTRPHRQRVSALEEQNRQTGTIR